jgi:hypothetical protein
MGEPECSCGAVIGPTDLISFKFYERLVGPYFVNVKFRCPACQKVGQSILKQEQWEQGLNVASPIGMHFMRIKPEVE